MQGNLSLGHVRESLTCSPLILALWATIFRSMSTHQIPTSTKIVHQVLCIINLATVNREITKGGTVVNVLLYSGSDQCNLRHDGATKLQIKVTPILVFG